MHVINTHLTATPNFNKCLPFLLQTGSTDTVRKNIIIKYICHLCLCGPNCTWKLLSSHSKLLSQTTFSCTWCMMLWSSQLNVKARGLVTTYMFSCIYFTVYTFFVMVYLNSLLSVNSNFVLSFFYALCCWWKSTQGSLVTNCVFFLKGLQWMCATNFCEEF